MTDLLSQLLLSLGLENINPGIIKSLIEIVGGIGFGGASAYVIYQCWLKKIRSTALLAIAIFMIALGARVYLIAMTPGISKYGNTDLCIMLYSGQVFSHGINPYLFSDKAEVRNQLRTNNKVYHPWVCETQERWNYHAASNLPLNQLIFGVIDRVYSELIAYRLAFVIIDSLISVILLLYLLQYWNRVKLYLKILIVLAVSALSPILMYWGVIYPEDKGLQILFMVSAIYFAQSQSRILRIYLSSFLLGASIAYKLLGIFLVPLCLNYILLRTRNETGKQPRVEGILYLSLSCFFAAVWFIPYLPESLTVLFFGRLSEAVITVGPKHASIWRSLYMVLPNYWKEIKIIFIIFFITLTAWGFFKKKLNLEITTGNALIAFTILFLEGGSLDRANMAIVMSILLMGTASITNCIALTKYYFLGGLLLYSVIHIKTFETGGIKFLWGIKILDSSGLEYINSVFVLFYVCIYLAVIIKALRSVRNPREEEVTT